MALFTSTGTGLDLVYTANIDGAIVSVRVDPVSRDIFVGKGQNPVMLPKNYAAELVTIMTGYVNNGVLS